jgi:hypothetical protein
MINYDQWFNDPVMDQLVVTMMRMVAMEKTDT